jgi:hypothetical protein
MPIWVVNRVDMGLFTEVLVFKGVDVGDVWLRGQALELGVIPIFAVEMELSELMSGVGISA